MLTPQAAESGRGSPSSSDTNYDFLGFESPPRGEAPERCGRVVALQGLAAIGRGEQPSRSPLSEGAEARLEVLLEHAGTALLSMANRLKEQELRGELCDALQHLSFRCFSAMALQRVVDGGSSSSEIPEEAVIWGPIEGAWGSVRDGGQSVEGALGDLTRWWLEHQKSPVSSQATVSPLPDHAGEEDAFNAARDSVKQQAAWLCEPEADELGCSEAGGHLKEAAEAAAELRKVVASTGHIGGKRLVPVNGLDLQKGLESFDAKHASVYRAHDCIIQSYQTEDEDIISWARNFMDGAVSMNACVHASLLSEKARLSRGLTRLSQAVHSVSLVHTCNDVRAEDPLGPISSISLQLQCERAWPLAGFMEDEGWSSDLGSLPRQQLCVGILSVCAVAEACGVGLGEVSVESFVVAGVGSDSVGELADALRKGECQVLLGACSSAWSEPTPARWKSALVGILQQVLDVSVGSSGAAGDVIASTWERDHAEFATVFGILEAGGNTCCRAAFSVASAAMAMRSTGE